MRIEFRREWNEQQRGGDAVLRQGRRWLRLAAYYGSPPGSHIGYWATRCDDLRGVNLRIGRRYVGPCLTLMAHSRGFVAAPVDLTVAQHDQ